MPNLQNLLKRRRVVVELDPEVHARLRARLASLHEPQDSSPEHELADPPDPEASAPAEVAQPRAKVAAPILVPHDDVIWVPPTDPGPEAQARVRARLASLRDPDGAEAEQALATQTDLAGGADEPAPAESEQPRNEVDAPVAPPNEPIPMPPPKAQPGAAEQADRAAGNGRGDEDREMAWADVPLWVAPDEPAPSEPDEPAPEPDLDIMVPTRTAFSAPIEAPVEPVAEPVRAPVERPSQPAAARPPAERRRASRALVSCPYCAEPLKVPPVASGRCPRCRQQIVVRRVGDRAIYLTEAALPVFLAERRRAVHAGRWTRERDRWLELAMAGGVEPANVTRLARQLVSEDVIAAARSLYMSTVERAARTARRERRWEDAGRLRSDQALALYRIARFVRPVPAEVLAVHRDGLASSLRGVAEIAKWAELRAAGCCEACRADDGRTIRIADELRRPSLPHEACQKGLCRCRWYLADRDRAIVSDLLRRQTRPHRQPRSAPDS